MEDHQKQIEFQQMQKQVLSGNLGVGISVKSSGVGSILNKGAPPIVATNTAQMPQLNVHN